MIDTTKIQPGMPLYYGYHRQLVHVLRPATTTAGRVRIRHELGGRVLERVVTAKNLYADPFRR